MPPTNEFLIEICLKWLILALKASKWATLNQIEDLDPKTVLFELYNRSNALYIEVPMSLNAKLH